MVDVEVFGVPEVLSMLHDQSHRLATSHVRGMVAAGEVLVAVAKQQAPVGQGRGGSGRYPAGTLRDKIHAGVPSGGLFGAELTVYGDRPFYARFVAGGTAAHLIQAEAGEALATPYGPKTSVVHPGTRRNPYMRRAFDLALVPMFEAWKRVM